MSRERICVEKVTDQKELDDIHDPTHSDEQVQHLRAAFVKTKLWPQRATIRIGFVEDKKPDVPITSLSSLRRVSDGGKMDPLQESVSDSINIKEKIKQIVRQRIQPLVNLTLTFVDDPDQAQVRIGFDPDGGAWSLVGTDCLKQKTGATMNLGWFDVGTVLHEFGHMLGMIHEHQNPRGEDIKWDKDEVYKWAKDTQGWDRQTTDTNIFARYERDSINGSDFDPLSIMLYFFPANLTTNDEGTHQNLMFSGPDVVWINKMYPTDNPDAAAQFYDNVYSETLSNAVAQSDRLAESYGRKGGSLQKIVVALSIVIVILVAIGIGYALYVHLGSKRKKIWSIDLTDL